MNKKILVLTMILIINAAFFAQIVAAANPIVPVNVDVSIDFTGERSFKLQFPNGGTRLYTWAAGQTHSDETFTQTIYWTLNENLYCTQSANQLAEYKNITAGLTDMLDICGDAVMSQNETETTYQRLTDLITEKAEYERLWKIEEDKRKIYQNSSVECTATIANYQRDYERCQSTLTSTQAATTNLKTCQTDLTDCDTKKSNNLLLGIIIGAIGGYMMWGRKKKGGPSEQSEAGIHTDEPNYNRYYREQPMDGPRR